MDTKKKLENIIWHIKMNRTVLGDETTLNHVLEALENMLDAYEDVNAAKINEIRKLVNSYENM
ncbi:hypothetical protein [Bacillus pseudomycoides]|uniref:hypothetical protein n=1 Tax=Bacillus pseudomycoides TaxID=64104 RepID=UPI000BF602E6|nr:hypothetical protein [Bacillus pseudomycoides]MED1539112.1 hypothetical protein [Bacillus pseudomycoides]PGC41443.1 hypothetical protein COM18_11055 [Bacillus pseudomycoides]